MNVNNDLLSQIFSCTRCGYCCQGETTVSLDEKDQKRMVEALGIEKNTVAEKFWRITKHEIQMKIVDGHCVFYNEGCTVHRGRPWRCAQWPLHPSILDDESNFRIIANSCPGINSDISYEEFCEIMRKLMGSGVISC